MMNESELFSEWEKDSHIDKLKMTEETIRTASLHQKYMDFLIKYRSKLIKLEYDMKRLKFAKYKYYRGEMSREELIQMGWDQYQGVKPLKGDMTFILDNDEDISLLSMKIEYLKNIINSLESILNQIKSRDWQIKNFIDWTKFQSGG